MVLLLLTEAICSVSLRFLHFVLLSVSLKSFHFSPSLQSGDILLLLWSVLQSSVVEQWLKEAVTVVHSLLRVSMGLTDRRKTAKNLVDSRKN